VAVPALALGAGTGALSGFLSGRTKPGETSRDRRHRILKNALIGAALGTTAGIGAPMGWEALNTPLHTHTAGPIEGAVDAATGLAMRHPLPLAAIGGGLWAGRHMDNVAAATATEKLRSMLAQSGNARDYQRYGIDKLGPHNVGLDIAQPGGAEAIARKFRQGVQGGKSEGPNESDLHSIFRSNELMQEAGHKGMSLKEMIDKFESGAMKSSPEAARIMRPGFVRNKFLEHIGNSGIVGSGLKQLAQSGKLPLANQLAKIPGLAGATKYDPVNLAEAYSKYFRPSVSEVTRWPVPAPLRWGLLGAGVLGVNALQNRLTGS
jgi:hypothetical protein